MSARVAFVVNGLGLGNSTRCHAVVEALLARGARVDVATMGNGLRYFADVPGIASLTALESYGYATVDGRMSPLGTLRSAGALLGTQRRNGARLARAFAASRPDVVVLDSIYDVRAARASGATVVAINNADATVAIVADADDAPASIRAHYLGVECLDYAFHRLVHTTVLSPVLDPALRRLSPVFRRIEPIVRGGFASDVRRGPPRRVVVMPSGSTFGLRVRLAARDLPDGIELDVVGPTVAQLPEGARFRSHGRVHDPSPLLRDADVAVINAGFSAVSEAVALRVPTVVVPVPGHAEQWANARTLERLGFGRVACPDTWPSVLREMLGALAPHRTALAARGASFRGAEQAAEQVLAAASNSRRG